MLPVEKNDIIRALQKEILSLQGFRGMPGSQQLNSGLGLIESAFPNNTFPTGAVHEFLSDAPENAAATSGFIAGLIGRFMKDAGMCLWISNKRTLFAPALKVFGIDPERVIFLDLCKEKDVLWAVEEALKCEALAAVVGELKEISFMESRRLQLAVEKSHITGFIHRYYPKTENNVTCVSRWKIRPLASEQINGMPGLGVPRWNVQLLKVRNGRPGSWQIEWAGGAFRQVAATPITMMQKIPNQKTG